MPEQAILYQDPSTFSWPYRIAKSHKRRFVGPERVVLADLLEFIKIHYPDVILLPCADT
jgi:hypothetical protein